MTKEERRLYLREWRKRNVDKEKAYRRKYHSENREARIAVSKARYHANKKEYHDRVAAWKKAHPEKDKFWQVQHYQNNREARIQKATEYYRNNRSVVRTKGREYSAKNKKAINAQQKRWYEKNSHIAKAGADRRRARLAGATVGDTNVIAEWQKRWKAQHSVRCYWCFTIKSPDDCVSDHIVPLAGGGSHSIDNLCICCKPCNQAKHAKPLAIWSTSIAQPALAI